MIVAVVAFAFNLVGLTLIVRNGGRWDRAAAAVVLAGILVEPFIDHVTVGTWRAGVAMLNLTLLLTYWLISMQTNRWWLVLLCSVQLMALVTHVFPLLSDDHFTRSGVQFRQGAWLLITLLLFAAAWEAWAARRFSREAKNDNSNWERV